MRLIELALVYAGLGFVVAVALARRGGSSRADLALAIVLFPLYVPVLLERRAETRAAPRIDDEARRLIDAIEAVRDESVRDLLPRRAHIEKLARHLGVLEAKIGELEAVLADNDLDEARALAGLAAAQAKGALARENAERTLASVRRLLALRDAAVTERDETLSLMARLRLQITVARFSGGAPPTELLSEIHGRVEGVSEAFAHG